MYITTKGQYLGVRSGHWRLTAVLKVVHRFESHSAAGAWYREQGLRAPANCMIPDNPPLGVERTNGLLPHGLRTVKDQALLLRAWDMEYRKRSRAHGVFLVCDPIRRELDSPLPAFEADMMAILGALPPQNPRCLSQAEVESLLGVVENRGAATLD